MASEAFRVVVVLLGLVAGAVAASGPRATERRLLQQTLCPEGCESQSVSPGSCVYDGTSGFVLCVNCKTSENLVAAPDGSCGCSPGSYLSNSPPKCQPCELGNFCLGGSATASTQTSCGPNLTTRNKGASRRDECVAKAGYRLTTSGAAEQCPVDTFSSGNNRLTSCTPCPAGLTTNQGLGKTSGNDCLVRPGWRAGSGSGVKAVRCPRGQYRGGFAAYSAAASCTACPQQTTTQFSASSAISNCTMLLPGRRWKSAQDQVVLDPPTEECPLHSWCAGGIFSGSDGSQPCLNGLWTDRTGATSVRSCRVPPGHFLPEGAAATVTICPPGTYQPSWLDRNSAEAKSCLTCGAGVQSHLGTKLTVVAPGATPGAMPMSVAGSSSDCYIRRGQGLVLDSSASSTSGRLTFRAVTCNGNHYGVNVERSILTSSPCRACPLGTVTSTSSSCSASDVTCPDGVTGGFYDKAACRYPSGATCSSIQGISNPGRTFSCSAPLIYYTSKAGQNIEGMTNSDASHQCCITASLTCSGFNCPTSTELKNPMPTGQTPSNNVCCVYRTGASCGDVDGVSGTADPLACSDSNAKLVWDPKSVPIGGKTAAQAQSDCCTTQTTSCTGHTCTTGVLKPEPPTIPGSVTTTDAMCCDTCESITCAPPTDVKRSSTAWPQVTPTQEVCCVYRTGASCGDVDGVSGTADPLACSDSNAKLVWDPKSVPIGGKTAAQAQSDCCTTQTTTCESITCAPPTDVKRSSTAWPQVYRTGASCGDVDGVSGTADPLACSDSNAKLVWDPKSVPIGGKTAAQAQSDCCTTQTTSCTGHTCTTGVLKPEPPTIPGSVTTTDAMCCDTCESITCAPPTDVKRSSTAWPQVTPTQEVCCVYRTGASCGDVDGVSGTADPLACSDSNAKLVWDPKSVPIGGKTAAQAQSDCCTTQTTSCTGHTCTTGVLKPEPPTIPGSVTTTDAMCCDTCESITCAPPTDVKRSSTAWPQVYRTGASCGDVDGVSGTADPLACSDSNAKLVWDPKSVPIGGKTAAQAQSDCCTTQTTSCTGHTCTTGVLKPEPPTIPGSVTTTDAMCCDTCESITCAPPTDVKRSSTAWPQVTPTQEVCCVAG
ncbi:hypothetical protein OEZ85_000430 [Tetradesmus obliquus]|uniref:Tyrosine-protein kinase ephrin type A/B receptor-like domain-containing protein n=1 Tax=Tetradesmus obliquus TaxID=3088 RepID=A0ABY8UQA1_TETOB|nr:hypothetical protein OEZ85_000430 [Tetradesmus obliquus]